MESCRFEPTDFSDLTVQLRKKLFKTSQNEFHTQHHIFLNMINLQNQPDSTTVKHRFQGQNLWLNKLSSIFLKHLK